jgi:hypothetical protein
MSALNDADKILNSTNVVPWSQNFLKSIFHFGPFANQLKTGVQYFQTLPQKNDKDSDEDFIYPGSITTNLSNLEIDPKDIPEKYSLTNEGKLMYLSHVRDKKIANARELQLNDELMTLLYSRISQESLITLASHKDYEKALDEKDTFTIYKIINETHRIGSSKTAIIKLRKFLTLSMENKTHQIYMHELKELEKTTLENFGSDKFPDMIPISTLVAAIYISGLDQDLFEYKIEDFFKEHPNMRLCDNIWNIIGEFHKYYLEKVDRNDRSKTLNLATEDTINPKKTSKCLFCFNKFGKTFPHLLKNCNNLKAASPEDRAKYASIYDGKIMPNVLKALIAIDTKNQTTQNNFVPSPLAPPLTPEQIQNAYNIVIQLEKSKSSIPDYLNCAILDSLDIENLSNTSLEVLTSKLNIASVSPPKYYDCGASLTVTGEISKVNNCTPLYPPVKIGGITSYILLTHKGNYSDLPLEISECYYSDQATATLFSLGYFQSKGGGFYAPLGKDYLEIYSPSGIVLDKATRLSNNLFHASNTLPYSLNNLIPSVIPPSVISAIPLMPSGAIPPIPSIPLMPSEAIPLMPPIPLMPSGAIPLMPLIPLIPSEAIPLIHSDIPPSQFQDNTSLAFLSIGPNHQNSFDQFTDPRPINFILSKEYGLHYPLFDPDEPIEKIFYNPLIDFLNEPFFRKCSELDILNLATLTSLTPPQYLYAIKHYNAEELIRAERANLLHECLGHPSDDRIIAGLNQGCYSYANVTPSDVRINRTLRGPCPDCLQAKMKNPSMPSSQTEPARDIGEVLSFDPSHLSEPSHNGSLAVIKVVDEKSGAYYVWQSKTYKSPDLYNSIKTGISKSFNAYGHKVTHMHTDADKVMDPLSILLAPHNIKLTCSPPEQHAQRVERYYQTATNMALAILASLPFVVPLKYLTALDIYVAHCMREVVNSRSSPYTPNYLIQNKHSIRNRNHPLLKWGAICMVKDTATQIVGRMHIQETIAKATTISEIGIMIGYDDQYPTSYSFLLQNGEIVFRAVFLELPNISNPYNWKDKVIYKSKLNYEPKTTPIDQSQTQHDPLPVDQSFPIQNPTINPTQTPPPTLIPNTLINPQTRKEPKLVADPLSPIFPSVTNYDIQLEDDIPLLTPPDEITTHTPDIHPVNIPLDVILPVLPSVGNPTLIPKLPRRSERLTPTNFDLSYLANMDITKINAKIFNPNPTNFNLSHLTSENVTVPNEIKAFMSIDHNALRTLYSDVIPLSEIINPGEITLDEILSTSPNNIMHHALNANITHPTLIPILNQKAQALTYKKATLMHPQEKIALATEIEIERLITLKTAKHISYKDIKKDAIKLPSTMLYTDKAEGRFTARLVPIGALQPEGTYGSTFAPTAMVSSKKLLIASFQAECFNDKTSFMLADCDIVAFFAKIKLESPYQIVIKLPDNLPHKLAGKFLELTGAMNGLKESNRLADLDLRALMLQEGFTTCPSDPCVYAKVDKNNPKLKCIIPFTVDDGLILCTHRPYWDNLRIALEKRYDTIKFNESSTMHCGIGITRHPGTQTCPTGPITLDQKSYITRFSENLGITHLPPIYSPSKPNFFKPSEDLTPIEPHMMQSIVGSLVHCLYTRDDARKEIVYMSTKQINPTKGDYYKAVHIARYLYSTSSDGPTYHTNSGPYLTGQSDASPNAHINAEAQLAVILSIGKDNAPVNAKARFEPGKPDQNVMAAEYHALFLGVNMAHDAVSILNHSGFPQADPVIFLIDSQTCIDLANAEHIPQKSKHINLKHHVIRDKVQSNSITLLKTKSQNMRVDLLTKYYSKTKFIAAKDLLLNTFSLSNN